MLRFILGILLLWSSVLAARVDLASAVIGEVKTEFLGKEAVSRSYLENIIPLTKGQPYTASAVNDAIQILYNTDHFEAIRVQEDKKDGKVDLTFFLTPGYRLSDVTVEGVRGLRRSGVLRRLESKKDSVLSDYRIHKDKRSILEYYKKKGFTRATVDETIVYNEARGTAQILYQIHEGKRARVSKIVFKGNKHIKSDLLRKEIRTEKRGLLSFLKGKGFFDKAIFAEDLKRLELFYQNQGYLDVRFPEETLDIKRFDSGQHCITIGVEEGPCYQLRDVTLSGAQLFRSDELLKVTALKLGEPFSPEKVEKAEDNIRMHYGQDGYLDTKIETKRYVDIQNRTVSLHFSIQEGQRNWVNSINIQGNMLTRAVVILREITLQPGDVFDLKRVRASEGRLRATGFFKEVHITPEATGIEGKKNLHIALKENRSSLISLGARVNSLDRLQGQIEFVQPSFDIRSPKTKFRGGGQKFRIGGNFGSKSHDVYLNLEEPWLFDRRLALGTELSQHANSYDSDYYAEKRNAAMVYLRKRLFEQVNGTLSYQLEKTSISDVDINAPKLIRDEEGHRLASKMAFQLSRDTRNSVLRPTQGNRWDAMTQVAGGIFGGDTEYWRNELKGIQYFMLNPYRKQTVSLMGRIGTVAPFGEANRVPFFDRYFLGGSSSLRGFRHRMVSPKELDKNPKEPKGPLIPFSTGGNSFGVVTVEYMIDVIDLLSVALFYDIGFVNAQEWTFNPGHPSSDWGFGLVIPLMGSALRLDFGFPIQGDQYLTKKNKKMNFEFSFGLRY